MEAVGADLTETNPRVARRGECYEECGDDKGRDGALTSKRRLM